MNRLIWQVLSQKYDTSPHYAWPSVLLDDDGQQIQLARVANGEPLLLYLTFWRECWYNVFAYYLPDRRLHHLYCNVAMPPSIQDHTITFVDLDLDVVFWPNGKHEVLDVDEFEVHRVKYNYPDWVQAHARQAVDDIIAQAEARQGPFSVLGALP